MRIAVFLCEFAAQAYLLDLLRAWRRQGHQIVVCRKAARGSLDTADLRGAGFDVAEVAAGDPLQRVAAALDKIVHAATGWSPLLALRLLSRRFAASPALAGCAAYLGVEKAGLVVADRIGRRRGVPRIYYSLELYVEDHPNLARFAALRPAEIAANARAAATVIQDGRRASVLRDANRLGPRHAFIHLPVGSASARVPAPSREGPATVLYVGLLNARRRVDELMAVAARLPPWARLHLHGPAHAATLGAMEDGHLRVTTGLLAEDALETLVASAAIGVALYPGAPLNERLTAFASHKLALYLKYGKPVIVPRNESYSDLMQRYECGVMVDDCMEIPAAVERIHADYAAYSAAAARAFSECYDIDRLAAGVMARIAAASAARTAEEPMDAPA